jgi:hypothetical protein
MTTDEQHQNFDIRLRTLKNTIDDLQLQLSEVAHDMRMMKQSENDFRQMREDVSYLMQKNKFKAPVQRDEPIYPRYTQRPTLNGRRIQANYAPSYYY